MGDGDGETVIEASMGQLSLKVQSDDEPLSTVRVNFREEWNEMLDDAEEMADAMRTTEGFE